MHRILNLPLDVVTPGPRSTTVLLLLVVTAFLSLRSPLMIVALPTLAWRFIATNQNFWGQSFHYDLVLMPIVFAALIDGAVRARRGRWRPMHLYARAAPTLAMLVGLLLCALTPFSDLVDPATYQPSPRAEAAERILSEIPDDATVETNFGLIAKLTHRTRVVMIGNAAPVVPQFVLIDALSEGAPHPAAPVQFAESLHRGTTYQLVYHGDGYTLLRRVP